MRQHTLERAGPRVVVVGAGFAGMAAVTSLARTPARVTLVDRNVYSTFQPLLYQVATGGLNPGDVAYPVRAFVRKQGARFRLGKVTGIDAGAHRITLADGEQLDYDYLILATGVTATHYGIPGAAEHSFGLYTRGDAIVLRDHIMARLERLDVAGPGREVNFTVVGGGATGVEVAGALAELRNTALDHAFPEVDLASVHIRLVEQAPALLAPFDPALRNYARRELRARGVDVRLSTEIREVTATRVVLAGGEDLPSDVTVWAAGVAAPAEVTGWGLPQGRGGRLLVRPDLRVHGQDRIFGVGDVALIDGQPLPQVAQPAIQAGRHAGAQILGLVGGRPTAEFHYQDKGIMATIGRRSAVVQMPGRLRVRGTAAWLAWLALHVFTLLGNRNRLSALLNLSWRYVAWGHGGGVIVGDDPAALPAGGPPELTYAGPSQAPPGPAG